MQHAGERNEALARIGRDAQLTVPKEASREPAPTCPRTHALMRPVLSTVRALVVCTGVCTGVCTAAVSAQVPHAPCTHLCAGARPLLHAVVINEVPRVRRTEVSAHDVRHRLHMLACANVCTGSTVLGAVRGTHPGANCAYLVKHIPLLPWDQ